MTTELIPCACGRPVPRVSARCPGCNRPRSHKDCYPDQYRHPLVGKTVRVRLDRTGTLTGVVTRVVQTRFGALAHLDDGTTAYAVADCTVVPAEEG